MAIRGLIFDLDGVLVDSARYHFEAWKRLAASLGIDFTEEQNEELQGISRADSLRKIVNWGGLELSDEAFADAMERKNTWYLELIQGMSPEEALPGSRAFMESAKGTYGLALGSASRNARSILQRVEPLSFFDALVDGNDTSRSNPILRYSSWRQNDWAKNQRNVWSLKMQWPECRLRSPQECALSVWERRTFCMKPMR